MDLTVTLGNVLTILAFVVTGFVAYFGQQRSVDAQFAFLKESVDVKFSALALQINTILEGDIRELRARVKDLETGHNEWTHALRDRTHKLADEMGALVLKVDRLERPRP